jgi:hypothetical protein
MWTGRADVLGAWCLFPDERAVWSEMGAARRGEMGSVAHGGKGEFVTKEGSSP